MLKNIISLEDVDLLNLTLFSSFWFIGISSFRMAQRSKRILSPNAPRSPEKHSKGFDEMLGELDDLSVQNTNTKQSQNNSIDFDAMFESLEDTPNTQSSRHASPAVSSLPSSSRQPENRPESNAALVSPRASSRHQAKQSERSRQAKMSYDSASNNNSNFIRAQSTGFGRKGESRHQFAQEIRTSNAYSDISASSGCNIQSPMDDKLNELDRMETENLRDEKARMEYQIKMAQKREDQMVAAMRKRKTEEDRERRAKTSDEFSLFQVTRPNERVIIK